MANQRSSSRTRRMRSLNRRHSQRCRDVSVTTLFLIACWLFATVKAASFSCRNQSKLGKVPSVILFLIVLKPILARIKLPLMHSRYRFMSALEMLGMVFRYLLFSTLLFLITNAGSTLITGFFALHWLIGFVSFLVAGLAAVYFMSNAKMSQFLLFWEWMYLNVLTSGLFFGGLWLIPALNATLVVLWAAAALLSIKT